jgi:hypothetical protein
MATLRLSNLIVAWPYIGGNGNYIMHSKVAFVFMLSPFLFLAAQHSSLPCKFYKTQVC